MTKDTTYYITSKEVENLFIIKITEYYLDFLSKPEFEVVYSTKNENAKVKKITQNVSSLKEAEDIVDAYLSIIKLFNTNITRVTKQTIIHEDIEL